MIRSLLFLYFAAACCLAATAKDWDDAYIKKLIEQGEIDKVIDHYKTAYASPERDPHDALRIADLYAQKQLYAEAVEWYEKEKAYIRESRTNMLNLARAYRMTGNYQQALDAYILYIAETGDVATVSDEANLCERLVRANAFADHYFFEPYSYNTEQNEKQLSVVRGNLVYTGQTPGAPGRIWEAIRQYNSWTDPVTLLRHPEALADYHHLAFSPDGNQCIYTLAENTKTGTIYRLYTATFLGGELLNPVPFAYNSNSYSCRDAVYAPGGQEIYFASDMPGGSGGFDIWKCRLDGKQWGKPQHTGKLIHSAANETAPFLTADGDKPILFFASDREGGFGGGDIYKATFGNTAWQGAELMPAPVNSPARENSYVFDPATQAGYVSTDRPGGKGGFDIFRIRPLDLKLVITARDSTTRAAIDYAYLQLYDNNTLVAETVTGNDGRSVSQLGINRNYTLSISKDNYRPRTVSLSTARKNNGDSVCLEISLLQDPKYSIKNSATGISLQNYIVFTGKFTDAAGKTILPGMRMVNLNTNKLRILDIDEQGAYQIKLMTNNNYKIFIEYQGHKLTDEVTTYGLDHGSLKLKNYVVNGSQYSTGENRILQPYQVPDSLRYLWQENPVPTAGETAVLSTSLPKEQPTVSPAGSKTPATTVNSAGSTPENAPTAATVPEPATDIYYKIQLGSYPAPTQFAGLEGYGKLEESVAYGNHIYRIGIYSDIQDVKNKLEKLRQQGYTLAFILQYRDNKVINIIK